MLKQSHRPFSPFFLFFLFFLIFYSQFKFISIRYGITEVNPDCPWCETKKAHDTGGLVVQLKPEILRLLLPSDPELLTDLFWLHTTYYYGKQTLSGEALNDLIYYFELLTENSPKWALPYYFGAVLLSIEGDDPDSAYYIAKKGVQHHPQMWELWFMCGYIDYFFGADYERAAKAIQTAALIKGAPPYLSAWAVTLARSAGGKKQAREMISFLMQSSTRPEIQELLKQKRYDL
ncbi:MAG: hypothetical protein CSA22_04755 [Deltaproteobacteria bacterium]|nr:MAG: hypothetical protein CSA22_04755 [Deltaproteobacteria bacterium]